MLDLLDLVQLKDLVHPDVCGAQTNPLALLVNLFGEGLQ